MECVQGCKGNGIWDMGVVLVMRTTGNLPFREHERLYEKYYNGWQGNGLWGWKAIKLDALKLNISVA